MKLWLKILIAVSVIGLVIFLYLRYLYFPHARLKTSPPGVIIWTNGEINKPIKVGVFDTGAYARGYEYEVTPLPNRQFRFIVYKPSQKSAPVVDNIVSFDNPPAYLTK